MRKVIIALGLAAALLSSGQAAKADVYFHRPGFHAPAFHVGVDVWRRGAWHHGWYGGRFGWWWVAGGVWVPYAAPVYPVPAYVTAPVYPAPAYVAAPAAVPVPPAPAPVTAWYYCPSVRAYYPQVPTCAGPWQTVPAQP
jgi:hypothetical protein